MKLRPGGLVIFVGLMVITNAKHRLDDSIYVKAAMGAEMQKQWDEVNGKAAKIGWPLWCGSK